MDIKGKIIKLVSIILVQFFFIHNTCFALEAGFFYAHKYHGCLSPALQISEYEFQRIYHTLQDALPPAIIYEDKAYSAFISHLEEKHGTAEALIQHVKDSNPQFSEAINYLEQFEKDANLSAWISKHNNEVLLMSYYMAKLLGYKGQKLSELAIAARFHDIGKCEINPRIINYKEPLSPEDQDEIANHPYETHGILWISGIRSKMILEAVLWHHENIDGTGYPHRLKEDKFSIEAKIIRVADSFSAMLGYRPYPASKEMAIELAISEIKKGEKSFYDVQVVKAFQEMLQQMPGHIINSKNTQSDNPLGNIPVNLFKVNKIPSFPTQISVIYQAI